MPALEKRRPGKSTCDVHNFIARGGNIWIHLGASGDGKTEADDCKTARPPMIGVE